MEGSEGIVEKTEIKLKNFRIMTEGLIPLGMEEWLLKNGFFAAPASTKYHGSCKGGLYYHSTAVCRILCDITNAMHLNWKNPRSPVIVGMFHDLCKINEYCFFRDGIIEHDDSGILKGHGDKSVMLLSQFMTLTEEEIFCIRYHMGAFVTDDWDAYSKAVQQYQNVLWTHTADMFASKVMGV